MQQHNVLYTIGFAAAVCLVCSVLVSSSAVSLEERQDANRWLEKQKNVLQAAGLMDPDDDLPVAVIEERFASFEAVVVNLETHQEEPATDPETIDQRKRSRNPDTSRTVERNPAQIKRVADKAVVYKLRSESGELEMLVLPVEGKGLWSTLYGFIALSADFDTVAGLTFYEHKETPGLGGEVDNAGWKALWPGRRVFDDSGEVALNVIKGQAGPVTEDPYRVDGLSGATITSRGVTYLLEFWLGDMGFGPYLDELGNASTGRRAA